MRKTIKKSNPILLIFCKIIFKLKNGGEKTLIIGKLDGVEKLASLNKINISKCNFQIKIIKRNLWKNYARPARQAPAARAVF